MSWPPSSRRRRRWPRPTRTTSLSSRRPTSRRASTRTSSRSRPRSTQTGTTLTRRRPRRRAWFGKAGKAVEAALRVAGEGVALDQCHEALKLVADTWSNINAIPFRSDVGDDVSNVDTSIDVDLGGEEYADYGLISPEALLGLAWPVLLARAASDKSVADTALLRMIKDAVDNGVAEPHVASWEETEREAFVGPSVKSGRARVAALFTGSKSKWSALASTKKKHKMRNAIDRRFDGPKHLRTRHYPSDSDEEGCILM